MDNFEQWTVFREGIITRFAPIELQSSFGAFINMKQTTTVLAYLNKFEQLQGVLEALPPKYLLENFLDGFKEVIKSDVMASRSMEFREAVTLDKLYEGKLMHTKKVVKPQSSTNIPPKLTPTSYSNRPSPLQLQEPKPQFKKSLETLAKSKGYHLLKL